MPQVSLSPLLRQQFLNLNGALLAGGKLFSYAAGTTTPQPTYTDETGGAANPNPIVLDSQGACEMWLDNLLAYKFKLQDSNGVDIFTVDEVLPLPLQFKQLGIAPYSYPAKYNFLNNQAASPLVGQSWDGSKYSSIRYEYEVQQGSTIFTNGVFYLQYVAGVWRRVMADSSDKGVQFGVVFDVSQSTTIGTVTLQEKGKGNGTVSLKSSYQLQSP